MEEVSPYSLSFIKNSSRSVYLTKVETTEENDLPSQKTMPLWARGKPHVPTPLNLITIVQGRHYHVHLIDRKLRPGEVDKTQGV